MRYFVKLEYIDPGILYPLEKFVQMLENIIIPSFVAITKMEEENKILAAGVFSGTRAGVLIVDVKSNEELTELLQSLPFWGLLKWEVTPMDSLRDRTEIEKKMVDSIKKSLRNK